LTDGRWRKHVKGLRERLAKAHAATASKLSSLALSCSTNPRRAFSSGPDTPAIADSAELAYKAVEQDILLGPGHLFGPELQPSPWMRFNVIFCDEPALYTFLQTSINATA
jgi:DNA-binding transcriptional MocR family regulator